MLASPKLDLQILSNPRTRFAIMGLLLAFLIYFAFYNPTRQIEDPTAAIDRTFRVEVPVIDSKLLAEAKDAERSERLFLEPEPYRHLLQTALNVSPPAAIELGRPEHMLPIAELRQEPNRFRGRWLWYSGTIEELYGPKQGHPVAGYSIYEAILRTTAGEPVLFSFTLPPRSGIGKGQFVRAEGFLLKVRDLTFPRDILQAPMLVGKELLHDYAPWEPVTALDPDVLATIHDGSNRSGDYIHSAAAQRSLEDDQQTALWHLAAFAAHDRPLKDFDTWRRVPALNDKNFWPEIVKGELKAGTPMRVLCQFHSSRTIQAQPNPAGITEWTQIWVQVRDLKHGKLLPIWIPKRIEPLRRNDPLEIRGHYYRRHVYETDRGDVYMTPLCVAADVDRYVTVRDPMLSQLAIVGYVLVSIAGIALFLWNRIQRRSSLNHELTLEARRRRRKRGTDVAAPSNP